MDHGRPTLKLRVVLRALLLVAMTGALVMVGVPPRHAQGMPSVGWKTISFSGSNDVGASASDVRSVALGDLDNDGDLDMVSGSADGEDYEVIAWENDGSPFTGLWSQNDVGASASDVRSVALGDLDNDGDLDIVSGSESGEDYEIIGWENDGSPFTGLWSQNDVGASTASVLAVALGDLDNDGALDILSASTSGEDYEVIAWENDGTPFTGLWSQNDVGASTAGVRTIAVGDLDNDGHLDIVSGSDSEGEDYEVIAWENDGSPFTGLWSQNDVGASTDAVQSVALGDLDNDGHLDIVSGSRSGEDYEVIAWQNDGSPFTGLWSQSDVGASTSHVSSVALGDLDNDGDLDVVSGSLSGEDYEVIAWENDGTPFSGLWNQNDVGASTASVLAVALGDLEDDGDLDIVSGSLSGEDYEVIAWENTLVHRNLLFAPGGNDVGASTDDVESVALGDLDNDGDLDIVSGSDPGEDYEVIAWENDGSPFTGLWTQNDVGASADCVLTLAVGDLDNDGDLDIVSGSADGEDYEIIAWQNDGSPFSGTWSQQDVMTSTASVLAVALGDLDSDGDLDIVSGSSSGEDYEVIAWENDGSPFSGLWSQNDVGAMGTSGGRVYSVALGDLDHDGALDIVSGSDSGEVIEVIAWENDGSPFTGLWSPNGVGSSTAGVFSMTLGDLDNDGALDIVSGSSSGEDYEVIAWENDGSPFSGYWPQGNVGASADSILSVALGDLDHDGDLDIVSGSGSQADYEVIVWENDGFPFSALWAQDDVGASRHVFSVAVGDLDHDGDVDVVSGGSSAGGDYTVIAWRNLGSDWWGYVPLTLKNYTP